LFKQEKVTAKLGDLQAENTNLKADMKYFKGQVKLLLKGQNSNQESHLPLNLASYETNQFSKKNDNEPSSRGLSRLPSSCDELKGGYTLAPMDGIHLLKDKNKIKAVFCIFPIGTFGKINLFSGLFYAGLS